MAHIEIDIYSIDKKIRDIWIKSQGDIKNIEKDIEDLENILLENDNIDSKSDDSENDSSESDSENKKKLKISGYVIQDITEKINMMKKERDRIENILQIQHFYTMDFSELMERHKKIIPNKVSFVKKKIIEKEEETVNISKDYLEILKKYNIEYKELEDLTKTKRREKRLCTNCGCKEFLFQIEQNLEICEGCGKQEEKSYKSLSFKDISRVNMSNKYTYERRIHFKDCMNQYQGKQNSTIHEKVYEDLEEQFRLHGLLNNSLDKKQKFERITKEHILLFLKETKHSKHYEDVVLIYHKMTDKKVDDISHIENQLMEDFDKISNLYDKRYKFTGKVDRKSFINTQYVLFQLLRRHKYPCKKEDFNMLKTLDRKSFHDEIVKDLFEQLDFNFTPIF